MPRPRRNSAMYSAVSNSRLESSGFSWKCRRHSTTLSKRASVCASIQPCHSSAVGWAVAVPLVIRAVSPKAMVLAKTRLMKGSLRSEWIRCIVCEPADQYKHRHGSATTHNRQVAQSSAESHDHEADMITLHHLENS